MPRRDGDLAAFWANPARAFNLLGWKPKFFIKQICEDTWKWQKNNPKGFKCDK